MKLKRVVTREWFGLDSSPNLHQSSSSVRLRPFHLFVSKPNTLKVVRLRWSRVILKLPYWKMQNFSEIARLEQVSGSITLRQWIAAWNLPSPADTAPNGLCKTQMKLNDFRLKRLIFGWPGPDDTQQRIPRGSSRRVRVRQALFIKESCAIWNENKTTHML